MRWRLDPVMPFDPCPDVATQPALVARVPDQKKLSGIVKTLGTIYPLTENQQFLKRVKKKTGSWTVLIRLGRADQRDLHASVQTLMSEHGLEPEGTLIPAEPPQTRAQFERSTQLWPCRFHEDKKLEDLLGHRDPELWGESALPRHYAHMASVLTSRTRAGHDRVVLVHPGWAESRIVDLERDGLCTGHPVMAAIKQSASDESLAGYLWSDCDVYLAEEPCLMCSMALVHARVRQIFFCFPSPSGALQTLVRLHALQPLNHKFGVFWLRPEHGEKTANEESTNSCDKKL